jgi:hypothetical protein
VTDLKKHVRVEETRYDVSCLPDDHSERHHFIVSVEHRGGDRWAVCWLGRCADRAGVFAYESIPSGREEEWLETHRFDLNTALDIAAGIAIRLKCNGVSVADVLARDGMLPGRTGV